MCPISVNARSGSHPLRTLAHSPDKPATPTLVLSSTGHVIVIPGDTKGLLFLFLFGDEVVIASLTEDWAVCVIC